MAKRTQKLDLYAFVAGAALKPGRPFLLECNCGGVVTIMPPLEEEYVICAVCESSIRMLVLEGDPGYIIGADADGKPLKLPLGLFLFGVQSASVDPLAVEFRNAGGKAAHLVPTPA